MAVASEAVLRRRVWSVDVYWRLAKHACLAPPISGTMRRGGPASGDSKVALEFVKVAVEARPWSTLRRSGAST